MIPNYVGAKVEVKKWKNNKNTTLLVQF